MGFTLRVEQSDWRSKTHLHTLSSCLFFKGASPAPESHGPGTLSWGPGRQDACRDLGLRHSASFLRTRPGRCVS